MRKYMTPHDLADRWLVDVQKVRKMIKGGELPATLIGAQYRIYITDIEEYERKNRTVKDGN